MIDPMVKYALKNAGYTALVYTGICGMVDYFPGMFEYSLLPFYLNTVVYSISISLFISIVRLAKDFRGMQIEILERLND